MPGVEEGGGLRQRVGRVGVNLKSSVVRAKGAKPSVANSALRKVAAAALGMVIFVGWLTMFQDRLLYFPDRVALSTVADEASREGLVPWPDAGAYRGLLAEPKGTARGTLVLFHGNAGHAGHRGRYVDSLSRLGVRVILAEYPGYGPREGELGEASLVPDARETVALVRRQFPGPLILAGESLGAGVAAAAANDSDVEALLLITPWDSLKNVAGHHYPWLPVGWLLRDRYDSVGNLAGFRGRVAVVVAVRDSIVPAKFGRALFANLPEPKRLWTIPDAEHNDWQGHVDVAWWESVLEFLYGG
jgi:hypothetical protein